MKKEKSLVVFNKVRGVEYRFELYLADSFKTFKDAKQVYGVALNADGKILLVSNGKDNGLPGGKVDEGESYEDTLKREMYEEAAAIIDSTSIKPFFYQKAFRKIDGNWEFFRNELRYLCTIKRMDRFVQDPDDHSVTSQLLVEKEELPKFLKWGKTAEFIVNNLP